ncbi:SCO2523 family variant P-loop protein [Nocardia asteroides]|uniref:SCO2523 family variant P-loop protein n=1 Tax=Nocardia asteroides TaxID=1824 RepID=UPI001E406ADA|nr:SCO2523 family variant P-loop protein [Nocardia asteroides]UGT61135.1 SCO2523 family variant P-loop protein [Nocardia asteroides]
MLVFATSDKGGTGRSVTSCNIAHRLTLAGRNVAYVDFDFGSPTAGALFEIDGYERGVKAGGGVHSYLLGRTGEAVRLDVGSVTERAEFKRVAQRAGRLALFPGDEGGADLLTTNDEVVQRCAELLAHLASEFHVVIVDLSAGRTGALDIALRATALSPLRGTTARWLVFHRWTRQHILAAAGLVYEPHGLLDLGVQSGHDRSRLLGATRFVRTAVPVSPGQVGAERGAQAAWLQAQDEVLRRLAATNNVGKTKVLGTTPIEPILLWREQVILDNDINAHIANPETVTAYQELARRLVDDAAWEM